MCNSGKALALALGTGNMFAAQYTQATTLPIDISGKALSVAMCVPQGPAPCAGCSAQHKLAALAEALPASHTLQARR
jgi:hypothetical protein